MRRTEPITLDQNRQAIVTNYIAKVDSVNGTPGIHTIYSVPERERDVRRDVQHDDAVPGPRPATVHEAVAAVAG